MTTDITVTILHLKTEKVLSTLKNVPLSFTMHEIKGVLCDSDRKFKYDRCSFRLEKAGKTLSNTHRLLDIPNIGDKSKIILFFKDLGPQISWKAVFYIEYAAPLIIYAIFWLWRQPWMSVKCPWLEKRMPPMQNNIFIRQLALICYTGHFAKRLLETAFVHRFSHATMPLRNLFKNCAFYWVFAAGIGYFTNHHLYTAPTYGSAQVYAGLGVFLFGELGNLSCHLALRNLRPAGSSVRRIPQPVPMLPFTQLFNFVACPNYTYEVTSWIGFTIMTQTLPAALFTLLGFGQMTIWALGKLHAYRKEFVQFPRTRKAIVPFFL